MNLARRRAGALPAARLGTTAPRVGDTAVGRRGCAPQLGVSVRTQKTLFYECACDCFLQPCPLKRPRRMTHLGAESARLDSTGHIKKPDVLRETADRRPGAECVQNGSGTPRHSSQPGSCVWSTCEHAHCVCMHMCGTRENKADLKRVPPTGQRRYHLGSVTIKIAVDKPSNMLKSMSL